jgi:hypothetical protein
MPVALGPEVCVTKHSSTHEDTFLLEGKQPPVNSYLFGNRTKYKPVILVRIFVAQEDSSRFSIPLHSTFLSATA